MDDITRLRCRNAALETELRLVKEQLAQAHGATNYLVTTLTMRQANQQDDAQARLQERLDYIQAENDQLRGAVAVNGDIRCSFSGGRTITSRLPVRSHRTPALHDQVHLRAPPTPPSTDGEQVGLGEETDLLSFDDRDSFAPTEARSTPSPNPHAIPRAADPSTDSLLDSAPTVVPNMRDSQAESAGFGASHADNRTQSPVTPPAQVARPEAPEGEDVRRIEHSDGTVSFVQTTPIPWFVRQWEEMHLLNSGLFVEDWEEENWEEWVRRTRRYTPEAWRRYYGEAIRPRYLEIKAKRAAMLGEPTAAEEGKDLGKEEQRGVEEDDDDDATEVDEDGEQADDEATEADDEPADGEGDTARAEDECQDQPMDNTQAEETIDEADEESTLPNDLDPAAVPSGTFAHADEVGSPYADYEQAKEIDDETEATAEVPNPEEGPTASKWAPQTGYEPVKPHSSEATGTDHTKTDATATPTTEESLAQGCGALEAAYDTEQANHQHNQQTPAERSALVFRGDRSANTGHHHVPAQHTDTYKPRGGRSGRSPPYRSRQPPRPQQPLQPGHALTGAHPLLDEETKSFVFSHADPSDLRTVLISNIPPNIVLPEVLEKVRGGRIVSANLIPTAGMSTKPLMEMNAVMVTILYARDAQAYVDFCTSKTCIFFWSEYWDAPFKARVSVLPTASRHIDPAFFKPDTTRILYLADSGSWDAEKVVAMITRWWRSDFETNRTMAAAPPMRYGRDQDGILCFQFASMSAASLAKTALEYYGNQFGGMSKGFLPDPCARAVEGLLEVAEAKAPEPPTSLLDEGDASPGDRALSPHSIEEHTSANDSGHATNNTDKETDSITPSPAYVHKPLVARANPYASEDVAIARALMNSYENMRTKGSGKKQAKPPHMRSRPRAMAREGDRMADYYSAEVLREDEAMGVEG
ncbi:hypothetical protein LTR85_004090 [Meristemomyces frigidus]|nr:hypothetical protein LTR85_004090 [Meristemomyces frigidus]